MRHPPVGSRRWAGVLRRIMYRISGRANYRGNGLAGSISWRDYAQTTLFFFEQFVDFRNQFEEFYGVLLFGSLLCELHPEFMIFQRLPDSFVVPVYSFMSREGFLCRGSIICAAAV